MQQTTPAENGNLVALTIRFTEDAMSVIEQLANSHGRSKADIVRLAIDNRLMQYLPQVAFINHEDALNYRRELAAVFDELQSIRSELNRIGINYNQELKLKQIEKRYSTSRNDYNTIMAKQREIDSVKNDSEMLNKDELQQILTRYEAATRKVCETLCRTLG